VQFLNRRDSSPPTKTTGGRNRFPWPKTEALVKSPGRFLREGGGRDLNRTARTRGRYFKRLYGTGPVRQMSRWTLAGRVPARLGEVVIVLGWSSSTTWLSLRWFSATARAGGFSAKFSSGTPTLIGPAPGYVGQLSPTGVSADLAVYSRSRIPGSKGDSFYRTAFGPGCSSVGRSPVSIKQDNGNSTPPRTSYEARARGLLVTHHNSRATRRPGRFRIRQ